MCELILIRGIPGSGKSTLATTMLETDFYVCYDHVEADQYFIDENGNYNYDGSKIRDAHFWCQNETRFLLQKRESVIVCNTFTTRKELKPYFEMAHELGIVPQVILLQNEFGSIHNVPDETIGRMKTRFEYDISSLFEEYSI